MNWRDALSKVGRTVSQKAASVAKSAADAASQRLARIADPPPSPSHPSPQFASANDGKRPNQETIPQKRHAERLNQQTKTKSLRIASRTATPLAVVAPTPVPKSNWLRPTVVVWVVRFWTGNSVASQNAAPDVTRRGWFGRTFVAPVERFAAFVEMAVRRGIIVTGMLLLGTVAMLLTFLIFDIVRSQRSITRSSVPYRNVVPPLPQPIVTEGSHAQDLQNIEGISVDAAAAPAKLVTPELPEVPETVPITSAVERSTAVTPPRQEVKSSKPFNPGSSQLPTRPGPEYVWIDTYTKADGTFVEGHWRHLTGGSEVSAATTSSDAISPQRKSTGISEPPAVSLPPTFPSRPESVQSAPQKQNRVWVDAHWRKTKNGRTHVEGHWRNPD